MFCFYFLFLAETETKTNLNECLTTLKELNKYENDLKKTIYKFLNKEKKAFLESSKYDLHIFSFDLYSEFLMEGILKVIEIQKNIEVVFKVALVSNSTLFNLVYLVCFYYYTTKNYTKIVIQNQKKINSFIIIKKTGMQMHLAKYLHHLNCVFKKMTNYNFLSENFLILYPIGLQNYVNNIILHTSHFFETDLYFYFLLIVRKQQYSEESKILIQNDKIITFNILSYKIISLIEQHIQSFFDEIENIIFDLNLITLKLSRSDSLRKNAEKNNEFVHKYHKKYSRKELFFTLKICFLSKYIIKDGFLCSENYKLKSIFLFNLEIKKLKTDNKLCYTRKLYLSVLNHMLIIENSINNCLTNLQNIIIESKYFITIGKKNLNSLSNREFEINVNMNCRIQKMYDSRQLYYKLNIKKTRILFNPKKYEDFISLLSGF